MNIKEKFTSELTIIGHNVTIEGNLHGEGNFRIDGKVMGSVKIQGNLTTGNDCLIKGEIAATNLSISGRVEGNMHISEKLTLEKHSIVIGDIATKILIIEEGATLNGNCIMHKSKENNILKVDTQK